MNFLKKIIENRYTGITFIIFSSAVILLSIYLDDISNLILPNTKIGIYDKSFWVNLLINLNSSIVDFLFLSLIIIFFTKRMENKKEIETLRREIKNFAIHSSIEIDIKKLVNLKRLSEIDKKPVNIQKIKMQYIDIDNLVMNDADLSGMSLYSSKLKNVNFSNCIIRSLNISKGKSKNSHFIKCTIRNLKLSEGNFKSINFEGSILANAKMNDAELSNASFKECDLQDATFDNSNLRCANFSGSKNINIANLCKARCIDYIVASEEITNQIKKIRTDVKIKPGQRRRGIEPTSRNQ